jgi:Flp pilus assembly protein TadG
MADEVTVGVGEVRGSARAPMVTSVRRRRRVESGAVTAEAAMVLPVLVAVALGLVWVVALAAAQMRAVDGAREVARLAARGEDEGTAVAHGKRVAPDGAVFAVARGGDQVRVTVVAEVKGPGGLFGFVPAVRVRSEAVAAEEPR